MDVTVIAIAGASCSGKTTLAEALSHRLGAALIRTDDYYHPLDHLTYEERCAINFDHPDTIDSIRLIEDIKKLREGQHTEAPRYDFTRHTRFPTPHEVAPNPIVIIEGLFPLCYPDLAELCTVRVFVDADEQVCYERRLERDVRERGRTPEEVHARFFGDVAPMFREHIAPTADNATVRVSGESPLEGSLELVLAHLPDVAD